MTTAMIAWHRMGLGIGPASPRRGRTLPEFIRAIGAARVAQSLQASARSFLKAEPDYLGFMTHDARVGDAVRRQSPFLSTFP